MSNSGRETTPVVREWSGVNLGCLGVVGSPSRMSGSGRETLTGGRETYTYVREWSVGHSGCSGVVGRPYRIYWSSRKALPDDREWSGGPPA